MRLSSDESRALAFVVGLIALAAIARVITRPSPDAAPPAAELDATVLEQQSEAALERDRAKTRPIGANERIDVNGAGADELDRLPGVGPALAARLVAARERAGAFDSAPDLRGVPGVGEALLARIAPHLAFGPGEGLSRRLPLETAAAQRGIARSTDPAPATIDPSAADAASRRPRGSRRVGTLHEPVSPSGLSLSLAPRQPLDLNRASAEQLDSLPGIGPALAAKIVAKRDSLRGFRGVDDLLKVRGIGAATLQRLRPYFGS